MPDPNTIKAWKDPEYRAGLTEAEKSQIPPHPAGIIEIEPETAEKTMGGKMTKGFICRGAGGITKGVACRGPSGMTRGFMCRVTSGITKGASACR